ncbi:hypothetical protein DMENIID0001_132600 [Sergentomyia squamirostris]
MPTMDEEGERRRCHYAMTIDAGAMSSADGAEAKPAVIEGLFFIVDDDANAHLQPSFNIYSESLCMCFTLIIDELCGLMGEMSSTEVH